MNWYDGSIELVDCRERTVATLAFLPNQNPEKALTAALLRWFAYGARGGYVRDNGGKLLAYR